MADTVLIERDGPIVTVVLNRPKKLNAIDKVTWIALGDAIEVLEAEDSVRCIVLRYVALQRVAPHLAALLWTVPCAPFHLMHVLSLYHIIYKGLNHMKYY